MGNEPKILFFDIETSHNIVASFQLKVDSGYLPHQNILKERFILAAAWKELGAKPKATLSGKTLDGDDLPLCISLHDALCDADIAIAHNGDRFDFPFLEARCLHHGLKPLPPIVKIDTLKIARRHFKFNSNRLDYLGQFLGVGQKQHVGNEDWLAALQGNVQAINKLAKYNIEDVLLLERVFNKLKPYVSARLSNRPHHCSRCGSKRTIWRGTRRTKVGVYPRSQCQDCGGWDTLGRALETFEIRPAL